ncbi:hypothetical protein ACFLZA_02340 [Candidatus Neomarinimicrobiota bacterium]
MSFKEKSILGSLILTIVVFGYYFVQVFKTTDYSSLLEVTNGIGFFIGAVVLMVLLEIILHIILAITSKNESNQSDDERDKLIDLKATSISYYILVFGVFMVGVSMLFSFDTLLLANTMLLFFIIAEIVGFSMQLYYYRRGV